MRCIGCKACMQACPYDSIYIDPDDGTAAKCHFCAHRTEVGLGAGLRRRLPRARHHRRRSGRAVMARSRSCWPREPVRVRKPEQGTQPKLYYIDADESAIVPTAARHEAILYVVASAIRACTAAARCIRRTVLCCRRTRWPLTMFRTRGRGAGKCQRIAGRSPSVRARWRCRRSPWRWDDCRRDRVRDIALSTVALLFTALDHRAAGLGPGTQRPVSARGLSSAEQIVAGARRFHSDCLQRAQRGLLARQRAGITGVDIHLALADGAGWDSSPRSYTAFLFGQCEGRDLWQTPLLPVHLIVQALLCGSAVLALLPRSLGGSPTTAYRLRSVRLGCAVMLHLLMLLGRIRDAARHR